MINWGDDQNNELILAIERGDIDPHNLDGTYLFGETVQLFPGYEGDGTPKARQNVITQFRKKLRNFVFDGTVSGRQKQPALGEFIYLAFIFFTGSPRSHFLSSPLAHVSELSGNDDDGDGNGDGDGNDYDDNVEESGDAIIQDQSASSAKKAVSAKKPSAGKPDPTSAITSTLAAVSL
jgi:hypothetical protein